MFNSASEPIFEYIIKYFINTILLIFQNLGIELPIDESLTIVMVFMPDAPKTMVLGPVATGSMNA